MSSIFVCIVMHFSVLYKQATLDDEPSVVLDPNKLSTDGTVALSSLDFSEDGNLLAYAYSKSGSDWHTIKVRNVKTGQDYPEKLERVKFSTTSWTYDNKGFFYAVNIATFAGMNFAVVSIYVFAP